MNKKYKKFPVKSNFNHLIYKIHHFCSLILCVSILFSCNKDSDIPVNNPTQTHNTNILLIIADDMGLDASPGYSIGNIKPNMPNLENMISTGIRFNNVWATPTCTPTRSTIITGKYGFRTGITKIEDELSTSEASIQKYIDTNLGSTYNHAVIGKWHLSTDPNHPTNIGVNYYAGSLTGGLHYYWNWKLTENNQINSSTDYNTSKYTDLAIDWIKNQTQPWFLWLAYNAPHTPFHLPSANLHSQGHLPTDQASIDANPIPYYMAMLEAMDSEIGRLLSSMSQEEKDNTTIIFIGDNGTPSDVAQEYNTRRVKGSIYQGGINVPMIISGNHVTRSNETENSLINSTDLFATIASIAGVNVSKINDSQNFKEMLSDSNIQIRDYIYSEAGSDSHTEGITIRNATHKYILFEDESEALFNLSIDPLEAINLLNSNQLPLSGNDNFVKEELVSKLKEIRQ